jgi:glyoxylase-like metal-dependent hydrolase (beta-lactamase superfamily II)
MEVAPGIHRIETAFGDRILCLYLFVGDHASMLVDCGIDETPRRYLLPYLHEIGLAPERIRYVVTSHADFDHVGGNRSMLELAPQAVLMCHVLDQRLVEDMERIIVDRYEEMGPEHGFYESEESKAAMRSQARTAPVDLALSGGERVRLSDDWTVEIWHTPGHSRGHLTIYDPRSDSLVICDAALYHAVLRADGAPAFPPTYRYVESYLATIQRLTAARPTQLLTSHYPIYRNDATLEFLAESRAFVERLDAALVAHLSRRGEPQTLAELVQVLGPMLGHWPETANAALSQPLMGHLERLQAYGRIQVSRDGGRVAYTLG